MATTMTEHYAPDYDFLVKTVIVGDSGVGKSSLLRRFSDREFVSTYLATIGVDFVIRTMDIAGKITKLQIWDTAGQERFRTITNSYYRNAHCILLCFDVTDHDSFKSVHDWYREVRMYASEGTQVMLVANKCDLTEQRQVTSEMAKQLADDLKLPLLETSAKTSMNVDQAFTLMAKQYLNQVAIARLEETQKAAAPAGGFSLLDVEPVKRCCVIL